MPVVPRSSTNSTVAVVVARTERLTPTMIRIVFGGEGLAAFTANEFTDAYVKLVFPRPDVRYTQPLDLAVVRATMPQRDWPRQRTYTVRRWDPAALELTVDFVVHGDDGLAGRWATAAQPGDRLWLTGPGGGYAPGPGADWHLLAGDESALPAIAAALERMPAGACGHAFIEICGPGSQQTLVAPAGIRMHWLISEPPSPGAALLRAVTALEFPPGLVHGFVHGEAATVRDLRLLLKRERGVQQSQLSISGYWRRGADDEQWRAVKPEWNRRLEELDAAYS